MMGGGAPGGGAAKASMDNVQSFLRFSLNGIPKDGYECMVTRQLMLVARQHSASGEKSLCGLPAKP